MLTELEIVSYLLQHQLVSAQSIAEGDLMVVDVSRRNLNFKVISEQGPCYLLKQGLSPGGRTTVAHEAAVYQLLHASIGSDGLDGYLPQFYGYDAQENILILELLRNAQTLQAYHAQRGHFSTTLAKALGNALGIVHRLTIASQHNGVDSQRFSSHLPSILSIHRPDLRTLRELSSANIQLIKIVQQFPKFCELLENLRQSWQATTLIHMDIKWDNCLVFVQSPSPRKLRLKIVDWELAGMGDPCWDVGSVFNDYLSFWLLSVPITSEMPPERFLTLSRYPLERMQPAMRAYWRSYVQQMALDAATAHEWLVRAVKYVAARLVQTGVESMQMSGKLRGNIICLLQLSLNIMLQPHEAIVHLLGIPLRG